MRVCIEKFARNTRDWLEGELDLLQRLYSESIYNSNISDEAKALVVGIISETIRMLDDLKDVEAESSEFEEKYKVVSNENKILKDRLNLVKIADNSKVAENLVEVNKAIDSILGLVERNVSSIVYSEKIKRNPGRKKDASKEKAIVSNYEVGMSPVQLQRKLESLNIKVSLPTIIDRMKEHEWYKG